MPEGRVYVCKWKQLPDDGGYRGEIQRPKLRADVDSIDELASALTDLIGAATGDFEPVIEFEPRIIAGGKPDWFRDGLVSVSPNSHFRFDGVTTLVNRGFCDRCKRPLGPRTSETLAVESMWPGDASFSWDPAAEGVRLLLFSEKFLSLLSDADLKTFDTRPVKMPPRSRKKFFEVVPKRFVREVAIKGLERSGWRCDRCGRVLSNHGRALGWGVLAISRDSMPKTPMFYVGDSTKYDLCMNRERWAESKNAFRRAGMSSLPVAVVERDQIDRAVPKLPEIAAVRRANSRR